MLEIAVATPNGPGDVSELIAWLGGLPPDVRKVAVLGKTEGPATLNDFSRDVAQAATDAALARAGLLDKSWRLFSTGCEGIATPVTLMLADRGGDRAHTDAVGLAVGASRSAALPPSMRCGRQHVDVAAQTVKQALADAGLTPQQVKLVLIKSPVLLPGSVMPDAQVARHAGSTGASRGAAALGAGIALGDVDVASLGDDPVGRTAAFATRTMAFSGTETNAIEAVVLGERPGGDPRWGLATASLTDLLDNDAVAGLRDVVSASEIVFFKAGIAADGRLRGRRTTVLSSDLSADKQLRAAASGFIAAHFGAAHAFISGGAEHQAPNGGCICAALFRKQQAR